MRFETHVRDWEEMAAQDPFWAVLTGKRDWNPQEFLATGETDVKELLAAANRLGFPHERLRALDLAVGWDASQGFWQSIFPNAGDWISPGKCCAPPKNFLLRAVFI